MSKLTLLLLLAFLATLTIENSYGRSSSMLISPKDDNSCAGRCNQQETIPGAPCQCNRPCQSFGDCCDDYVELCLTSCVDRCTTRNTSLPCQCNTACANFGDCCPDYDDVCDDGEATSEGPELISDEELSELSEELLLLESVNNAANCVTVDLQGRTEAGATEDLAPLPLLTLRNCAYVTPTISRLLPLHDNYIPDVNQAEVDTPTDLTERENFLDAIFATGILNRTQEFLTSKGLPNGRDAFHEIWFEHYSRSEPLGALGSSGFEHVFLGELNNQNIVSGFHQWLYFAREENNMNLNYRGWMDYVDFGEKGSIIEHNFMWLNKSKDISSHFIGISPELELSLFTVCFYARPDAKCPISLNGHTINIQTYQKFQNDKVYVSTAYGDLSDNEEGKLRNNKFLKLKKLSFD